MEDELATRVGQINEVASRRHFAGLHGGGGGLNNLDRLLRIDGRDGTWTTAGSTAKILKVVRRAANWRWLEPDVAQIVGRIGRLLVGCHNH